MHSEKTNPPTNILKPGISEAMVLGAIDDSGYPLQLEVANILKGSCSLEEEWAYLDPDAQVVRTIDIVATHNFQWSEPQPRARPAISFVIECKQSELPYVFFLSETRQRIADFPLIAGLKSDNISITSDDDPSSWIMNPLTILDLHTETFLQESAPFCMTLSKCVRKGKGLVLSGSEAYQNIIFPITKSTQHRKEFCAPPSTAYYFDCILIIGLAVIDAPMVGVRVISGKPQCELMPWVRVVRHQPRHGKHKSDRSEILGVDIVHKDFFQTYIFEHAIPFAEKFAALVLKHHHVLADARGFVSGMGEAGWENFEHRLQVSRSVARVKRAKATLRALSGQTRQ